MAPGRAGDSGPTGDSVAKAAAKAAKNGGDAAAVAAAAAAALDDKKGGASEKYTGLVGPTYFVSSS